MNPPSQSSLFARSANESKGQPRVRVAFLSLPARTQAILEYFILGAGRTAFSQSSETQADAVIVDHDNPESRQHWEAFRTRSTCPALVLSIVPIELEGTVWVQKPATPAALLAAAARLAGNAGGREAPKPLQVPIQVPLRPAPRPAMSISIATEAPAPLVLAPSPSPSPSDAGAKDIASTADAAPAPASIPAPPPFDEIRYCGIREDRTIAQLTADPDAFYRLDKTLLYVLKDAYSVARKWNAQTHLSPSVGGISFDPRENRVYLECRIEPLRELCAATIDRPLRVQTMTTRDFQQLRTDPAHAVAVMHADSFLWEIALETARGRLPAGTDVKQVVYLKRWPNLTRMLPLPHAMRIVALFAVRGASLADAPRLLDVPQRYVFACYNALAALDLLTNDGTHLKQREKKAHKNRQLLTRLFRWLRGKA